MNNLDPFDQAQDKSAFLLDKWQYWTSENRISKFYNNLIAVNSDSPAVEILDNGYILVSHKSIEYTNLITGNITRITKDYSGYDILALSKLYDMSQQLNTFRMDKLNAHSKVKFQNINCLYTEFVSPNSQYGKSVAEKMLASRPDVFTIDDEVQTYRGLVEDLEKLLNAARQVSYDVGCGLPRNLLDPTNRFLDSVGFFFSNMSKWDTKEETVVNLGLEFLNWGMTFSSNFGDPSNEDRKQEVLNYAETLWKRT